MTTPHAYTACLAPHDRVADPLSHGVYQTCVDGHRAIHNHGEGPIAVLTPAAAGPIGVVVAEPDETIPLPAGDTVHYVQTERIDGAPTLLGMLRIVDGELTLSTLSIPTRRQHLDFRYLTPWSADRDGGFGQQITGDPTTAGISFQYRIGAEAITVRNRGGTWIAVEYQRHAPDNGETAGGDTDDRDTDDRDTDDRGTDDGDRDVVEVRPHSAVTLPVRPESTTGQVFSIVGRRVEHRPVNHGSIVIMAGTVVYTAIPQKNLYLAVVNR